MLNVHAMERRIEAAMDEARVPGLALGIVRGQAVVYARGFGVTSVEDGGISVTPQTLFRIGSITKPLTGTAVMRLVDTGQLELDRTVKHYLPWFSVSDPEAAEQITLRMLLTHTSGLPHDHRPFGRRDPQALEARIRDEVPRYALVGPPGSAFSYSNTGIHVVAHVMEVATGKQYPELMQDLVFGPLAMGRTTFDPTVAMTYPLALSHILDDDGALRVQHRYADNAANYASGQAISTVLDLANFAAMHINHGSFDGQQVLSLGAVEEMQRPQVARPTAGDAHGLTFAVKQFRGLTCIGHDGAITNFGATLQMVPEQAVAVLVLYNRLTPNLHVREIVNGIFDELLDIPAEGDDAR